VRPSRAARDNRRDMNPPAPPQPASGSFPAASGRPSTRQATLVWSVALAAYVVAVLHRTSFGVAGLEATARYHVSAGVLAGFTVLQLVMYAGLQVPVGVALDRLGSRRLLAGGALVMATGQLVLAVTTSVGVAYVGRALVGAGDAATFISVLRLVPAWFPARRVPVLTQLTGLIGQLGQVASAVPLVALLQRAGWEAAFGSAAGLGVLVAALAAIAVRDSPAGAPSMPARGLRQVSGDLVSAWRHPGTRLGLWTHFTTQFAGTVFTLTWGFPFLVAGEKVGSGTASALFTLFVVVGICAGPITGLMVQRHPLRRSWLVLAVVAANAGAWTAVLAWPGRAPLWLLVVLVLALASGGPGSMIGFDFARTFNPPNRLGTATGIVNVGGFVASLVTIQLVGLVLDARSGGSTRFTLDDFRIALSVQYLGWGIGLVGILAARRKVRRRMAAAGVVVPPLRDAVEGYRRRRRSGRD
jgi:MFS family permease